MPEFEVIKSTLTASGVAPQSFAQRIQLPEIKSRLKVITAEAPLRGDNVYQ